MEHGEANVLSVPHLGGKFFVPDRLQGLLLGGRSAEKRVVDIDGDVRVQ